MLRHALRDGSFWQRQGGYVFIVCVFLVFLQFGLFAANKTDDAPEIIAEAAHDKSKTPRLTQHPIPHLMDEAENAFRRKVDGQSKTLKAAVAEYKKRYKRNPPKGFDQWFAFAQKADFVMMDEFDAISEDLEPFWALSGREMRRRAVQVGSLPSIDIVRIRDGKTTVVNLGKDSESTDVSARAQGFKRMTEKFTRLLPDLDFPINARAEGRVVVPWEHRQYPNLTVQDSSLGVEKVLGGPFTPDWQGESDVWEAVRRTCHPSSPARRLYSSVRSIFSMSPRGDNDFHFLSKTSSNLDLCDKPHAHYQQGHLFSDWRTIPALYPVFSPAKAKGFLDIRIPSHYYYGSTAHYTYGWDPINLELKELDDMEVPWQDKQDKIFWRGASTGGGNSPPGYAPQYHRHRFVRMASSDSVTDNKTITFLDPAGSHYVSTTMPLADLNYDVMDVAFVKATNPGAYPGGLEALEADHHFGDAVALGTHWSYKYVADLDGMGYSGKFMAYLASDSVPIKSTVYDEYYSDWIQPWVHFIPLSTTYKEIYNIYAYFSGPPPTAIALAEEQGLIHGPTEDGRTTGLTLRDFRNKEGDHRLKRIARGGKQWKKTMGRKEDMEVYLYRLCLEWARLMADDRDAMAYKG
ncbi:glycosyltransferase family 90 protein [Cylindrobasidium torrendii FP15055 ss-10]|uniref:Glycosyltransferase family 90 protein n=1 Tax=Cylindrobasidium torrendii FP15055 ss-10 TaxID=1314674 RepID=A0A0D7BT05_9AGAR|nr:glycosyltransferase family 90 protein [Cylindrobasidium torrendii FP15055 ss-10]